MKSDNNQHRLKSKSQQHLVFPGGLPSKYYPGPTLLNFGDLTRTGAFNVVWPLAKTKRAASRFWITALWLNTSKMATEPGVYWIVLVNLQRKTQRSPWSQGAGNVENIQTVEIKSVLNLTKAFQSKSELHSEIGERCALTLGTREREPWTGSSEKS
jgi:hypothetical protein